MSSQELRTIRGASLRADKPANGKLVVRGRAASYNVHTVIGKGRGAFREMIEPDAFKSAVARGDDAGLTLNHSSDAVYGRVKAGNLALTEDARGLAFTCTLPDTTAARDLFTNVQAGLYDQCSFAFTTDQEDWLDGEDAPCNENDGCGEEASKLPLRVLRAVTLHDVSIVDRPAYSGTSAAASPVEDLSQNSARVSIEARNRAEQIIEQRAKKAPCRKPRFATDDERHAAMERINQELRADQLRRLAEADRSIKISRAVGDLDLQSQYALDLAAEEDARFEQAVRITRRNAHWLAHPSESGLSAMDYLTWLRQFQET